MEGTFTKLIGDYVKRRRVGEHELSRLIAERQSTASQDAAVESAETDQDSAKEIEALVMARTIVRTLGSLVLFTNLTLVGVVVTISVGIHRHWCDESYSPSLCRIWMQVLISLALVMLFILNIMRNETPVNMFVLFAATSAAAFSGGFLIAKSV